MRPFAFAVATLFAVLLPMDIAVAAPPGVPDQPLDLELRGADIGNVFRLLGEVSKREIVLDPCVQGKVDLNMKNAPLPVVYDVLASRLRLRYEARGAAIAVTCLGGTEPAQQQAHPAPEPRLEARLSLSVKAVAASALLAQVAKAAGLAGADYRGAKDPPVTLTLEDLRIATILVVLSDATGLRITVVGDRLVAAPAPDGH
jgi:hypothetical protein